MSDSHLGAGDGHPRRGPSGLTMRQEDIIAGFTQAVDAIIAINPSLCIHSGDLFHAVKPSNRIMAVAAEQLHRLAGDKGIPTVVIGGNHDTPRQPHAGTALEVFHHIDNLYIAVGGGPQSFAVGDVRVQAVPHCLTASLLKEALASCRPDSNARYNVLVMHGVAAGMPEFSMADLGEQELPLEIMEGFDYVALGHFHNHAKVASRAYYAGSTDRLSQAERDAAKGFVVVDLEPFSVQFHEIACRPMLTIDTIDATGKRGDQLADLIKEQLQSIDSSDKIVRVKVEGVSEETLRTIPAEVIASLKRDSFSLDITFEKDRSEAPAVGFGRSAIGRLDKGFLQFLEVVDLEGFDRDLLSREALKYLAESE
ncbi:MAG: metallophosphoesterase [Candidatus Zixiibacteriota bacterium]|nr:MAG: metallophosphoesterase [candidate division Zixibacteria bacterium]